MMKKTIKIVITQVIYFIKMCLNAFRWLLQMFLNSDFRNHIVQEVGQNDFVILGNGDSLFEDIKKIDIINSTLCAVNFFYKSPLFKEMRPCNYVLADPYFFTKREYIEDIISEVEWEMKIYVPYVAWKKNKSLYGEFKDNISVIPYNSIEWTSFDFLRFYLYKKGMAMPRCQNVLVPSIYIAINRGYKRIVICGADNSWTKTLVVDEFNRACTALPHFYDKEKIDYKPWVDINGKQFKIHEILNFLSMTFASYHMVRKYADFMNCKIVNLTKGSFIDAFERKSFIDE